MGEDEGELANAVGGELCRVQVLRDEDAVVHVEKLGHFDRARGMVGRGWAVAPRIASGEGHALSSKPAGQLDSRPRLAGEVGLAVVPVRPPAGMEEDRISRLGLEVAKVFDPDHVAGFELLDFTRSWTVDGPAPVKDLRARPDAEVRRTRRAREGADRPAVVAALAHLQMAKRVEVRPELHRAGDDLGHPVDVVLADWVDGVRMVRSR